MKLDTASIALFLCSSSQSATSNLNVNSFSSTKCWRLFRVTRITRFQLAIPMIPSSKCRRLQIWRMWIIWSGVSNMKVSIFAQLYPIWPLHLPFAIVKEFNFKISKTHVIQWFKLYPTKERKEREQNNWSNNMNQSTKQREIKAWMEWLKVNRMPVRRAHGKYERERERLSRERRAEFVKDWGLACKCCSLYEFKNPLTSLFKCIHESRLKRDPITLACVCFPRFGCMCYKMDIRYGSYVFICLIK